MNSNQPHVLIAPLDWGLGHATRCIPVIRELLNQQARVTICASGSGAVILKEHFPDITFTQIPGVEISYPENGNMTLHFAKHSLKILKSIHRENHLLSKLISTSDITHIISDNRFGCYHPGVKSAFITHQVRIKSTGNSRLMDNILFQINKSYIHKFHELWIPDEPGEASLSGDLSNSTGIKIPVKYLGCLSRFTEKSIAGNKMYDIIVLLSGPEPQRSLLEKILIDQVIESGKTALFVRGLPGNNRELPQQKNIRFLNHISDEELIHVLHPNSMLICRSGYSTLMDLKILGHKKVCLIPTPGQTEQEYLAHYHQLKKHFIYFKQNSFNLKQAFKLIDNCGGLTTHNITNLLSETIFSFLKKS